MHLANVLGVLVVVVLGIEFVDFDDHESDHPLIKIAATLLEGSIADDYWYFPCDDLVLVMIGGQAVEPDHGRHRTIPSVRRPENDEHRET